MPRSKPLGLTAVLFATALLVGCGGGAAPAPYAPAPTTAAPGAASPAATAAPSPAGTDYDDKEDYGY